MLKIAQCWDDGVANDARLTDIFRKYNAKATFNLNPELAAENTRINGWRWKDRFDVMRLARKEYRSVYEGFEVASHGMKHLNADEHPLAKFMADAIDARHFLEDLFQRELRGYAWPCGRTTPEAADAMQQAGFAYGRTCANTDNVAGYKHPMLLASSCHFQNPDFEKLLDKARKETGLFYFWGHSYELADDADQWARIERIIADLSGDPDVEWINVADIVKP